MKDTKFTKEEIRMMYRGFKQVRCYMVEQKNLAKYSDTCSVTADRLCIGSPRLVGGRKAGNSNM